jgi:PAS domain S-box-containing protein
VTVGTSELLRLVHVHTPAQPGLRSYAFASLVAALALVAVVLLQWSTGLIVFTPALFAVLVVTWYSGIWPGLIAFLVVASVAPALMSLPIGEDYAAAEYVTSMLVAVPLALLSAVLVHQGRQAIVSLHRTEDRFEAFMTHLPGSAWIKDVHGRYVYANADGLRILKLSREELAGKTDAQLFPSPLASQLHDPDALPLVRREVIPSVESFQQDDGTHDYLVVRFPMLDAAGEPEFLGAVAIDITDRARVERQLAEHTAQLQLVIDQVPAFVGYIDRDRRFVTVNRPLAEWFALSPSEMRGKKVDELDLPDTSARTTDYIDQALRGEAVQFEIDVPQASGDRPRWFEAQFVPHVIDGSVAGFSSLILDITERKLADSERALLAPLTDLLTRTLNTEETAQALITALVPGFVDGAAVYFTHEDTVRGVTLPAPGQLASGFTEYRVDPDSGRGVAEVLRSGLPEFYRRSPEDLPEPAPLDGRDPPAPADRRVSTMLVPLRVHDRIAAVLAVWTAESGRACEQHDFDLLKDVARRAERAFEHSLLYEESLRIAEELRVASNAKDEFLGTVSHELRTPITIVLGNASLLATRHREMDAATISASLNDLLGQAERLHRVVENMLILTRLETATVETEPLPISQSISRIIAEAQRQQPGRVIRLESADWGLFAIAAESYIQQVMLNFLANAIRFSPPGEPIDVTVRQTGDTVEVRVLDSGIGLHDEDLEALFVPFYRSPRVPEDMRGIGIGLSVSKRLIEALGGTVWARRREQRGAEFGFSLPMASDRDGALELGPTTDSETTASPDGARAASSTTTVEPAAGEAMPGASPR